MSQEFLRTFERVIAPAPDHISVMSRGYEYLVANDAYLKCHGKKREEIIGRKVAELFGSQVFNELIKGNLDRCFAGETVNYRAWFDFTAAGRRFMDVIYYPYMPDGNIEGAVVVSRDITDQRLAEERLEESEEKYRHLFENLNDAAFLGDCETGLAIETNKMGEVLMGMAREEILGMHQSKLHPPGKAEEYRKKFAEHIARGKAADYEGEVIRKDGTIVPVHISAAPVTLGGRKVILGLFRDITERKKMEAELLKAQKLESLGKLSGGLAHEFNNLLTVILSNVSLAMFYGPGELPKKRLEVAEMACLKAKELMRQFLTFARGNTPVKKRLDLRDILAACTESSLSGLDVKCELMVDEGLMPVEADPEMLSQALRNVVLNAAEAMRDGGVVRITARNVEAQEGGRVAVPHVEIAVKDTGSGIDEKDIEKIFDPYFTTKSGSSGLGLSVAYSVIDYHGGTIEVESSPDRGTAVSIRLPAQGGGGRGQRA